MQSVGRSSRAGTRRSNLAPICRISQLSYERPDSPATGGRVNNRRSHSPGGGFSQISPSRKTSPARLLIPSWRSLVELRLTNVQEILAQFESEAAGTQGVVSLRLREFSRLLGALLVLLTRQDTETWQGALALLETIQQTGAHGSALHGTRRFSNVIKARAHQRVGTQSVPAMRGTAALSPREHSILRSMSAGLSNKRIAQELQIAPETVKSHSKGIFSKLAVRTRAHAVATANALGLL